MGKVVQSELFFETIHDAYKAGVDFCGGPKKVGAMLFPEKSPEEAGRMVRACINPERSEKFSEEQRLLLLRIFREAGFHGVMHFLADSAHYERPRTIEPEDQAAEIQRAMDATMRQAAELLKRYERIKTVDTLRAIR
jgi:hypothetical protein